MNPILLITGGSRGIGAATARLAAGRGYDVCINYRENRAAAESVANDVQRAGRRAIVVAADVSREADVLRLFVEVDERMGRLAGLVNNAGIVGPQMRVDAMSGERIERLLAINVLGSFLCAREAVRRMSTRHGGSGGAIVNVSSAASRIGSAGEYVDYAATKGALDTMTLGLAREVAGEGIRVNAVRPGIIDTEIHASGGEPRRVERLRGTLPMQREGRADEVAQVILWLLSDGASYVTGTFVDVAGGR